MSDIQKIWNYIPESPFSEKEVEEVVNRKSISEVERFKQVLKLEVYISFILLVPLWFVKDLLRIEIFLLFCSISFIGCLLNYATLWRLKRLELYQELRHFLVSCIRVLKSFVIAFILTVQVVGLFVVLLIKSWKAESQGWGEWLSSSDGLLLALLLIVINAVLIGYAWVFYVRRIRSLVGLLREIDDSR